MDLENLNETIYQRGKELLERKEIEVNTRYALEIAKLEFKSGLDKKEFTNEDKREMEACKQPAIAEAIKELRDYKRTTQLLELDQERDLRAFTIFTTL